jgi:chloride channel protein, CIC family
MLGGTAILWVLIMRGYGVDQKVPPFYGNGYPTIVRLIEPGTYGQSTAISESEADASAPSPAVPQPDEPSPPAEAPPLFITALILLTLFKAVGTCLTLASGGSGGVFAPSLFIGATTGAAFGLVMDRLNLTPGGVTPASYALVGMAAVIAGTTFAPLTAILLIFELTREPFVMVPAMLSSIIAAIGSHLWMGDSIYTMKLRQAVVLLGVGRDLTIMRRVQARTVAPTPLPTESIYPSDPLSKLISMHMPRTAPDFVVVDEHGKYLGMVTGEDLRTALVDREAIPLLLVAELLRTDLPTVDPEETLDTVLDKFAHHDVASLCLMSPRDPHQPLGLITRAKVIRCYQEAIESS